MIDEIILETDHVLMGDPINVYKDKMIIRQDFISYVRFDYLDDTKILCTWDYKVNSELFKKKFIRLTKLINKENTKEFNDHTINNKPMSMFTDCGDYELSYTGNLDSPYFLSRYDNFLENKKTGISRAIKSMVPKGEPYSHFLNYITDEEDEYEE